MAEGDDHLASFGTRNVAQVNATEAKLTEGDNNARITKSNKTNNYVVLLT